MVSRQFTNFKLMKQEIINLVEQAKTGSERAFSELYNKYYKTVWFTVYNIVKNRDVTEDLISVVFTKAYMKMDSYTEHLSYEMWLKTIAVNSAIDYIRRMKNEKLNNYIDDEETTIQLSDVEKSPEDSFIVKEKLKLALEAIPTLKKQYRDLIQSRIDGLSYKDIAEKLAIDELTVKSNLNKARNILKQKINYH